MLFIWLSQKLYYVLSTKLLSRQNLDETSCFIDASAHVCTIIQAFFFFLSRRKCVKRTDAPAKWYWSQVCQMRNISVNLVNMLWTILSFDL